ncbi:LacI family transcriptional regulator [Pseudoduganella flava]|uniref:LacI family transcriptional regulator n=1 Tax=Pseudoduganella flava TaxID=871742 RepID=A0A562PXQ5_9BURK|nr:LacI family DNA-binding transcriptional regulator [Pseudoduganella flava]QGZ39998.1 substrate-binding domain-containing protein [Pseudoduganella flava]TWI48940.1 LacI family transcriptional regulator [Pseudoduganella flava]
MATIKDVARLAGVGLGTASRVVSGKGAVSPATQAKVRKAIEELGFRPSHAARSLLSGFTKMIGVYIPILKGTFYTPILQMIDTELRANGLHMVVAFGVGQSDARGQAVEGIEFLMERGCDGIISMSNNLEDEDFAMLAARGAKIVVVNSAVSGLDELAFQVDHRKAGALAAQALVDQGHSRIAVIAGPATAPDNAQRIEGFMKELKKRGVDTRDMWIAESDFSPEGGFACAKELLESGYPFTALFCANDEMAVGALSHFQEAGVRVPQDVSVLGYDDTPSAEFSAPRLTSVHIPWRDVVKSGLNALLNRCYGGDRPVSRRYPISVTQRASVGPAPQPKTRKRK